VKNGEANQFEPFEAVNGGNVKYAVKLQALAGLVILGAGFWLLGCKSAPELTQAQALAMIQADYNQAPPAPIVINVGDQGMGQGLIAKYWVKTKPYPNGYWADFTLTPDGKKVLKLVSGGDVIQWRPDSPGDPHFQVQVQTVAANRLKGRDVTDIQAPDDNTRVASYTEDLDYTGVPDALQGIAHDPGNKPSSKRVATFVLTGGAWTLQSIK
jgi:hypothetical protein